MFIVVNCKFIFVNYDNLAIKNSIANTNLTFTNKNIMYLKLPMYKKTLFFTLFIKFDRY